MRAAALLVALVAGLLGCKGTDAPHPVMGTDLQAPVPVVFGPTVSTIRATSIIFDLVNRRYTLIYLDPVTGISKTTTGVTPAPVQTALDNHISASIESAEGWDASPDVLVP